MMRIKAVDAQNIFDVCEDVYKRQQPISSPCDHSFLLVYHANMEVIWNGR